MASASAALLLVALLATFLAVRCAAMVVQQRVLWAATSPRALVARGTQAIETALAGNGRVAALRARRQQKRRAREMREAMPEMLRLLCIALDSGSSLVQALDYAASNCPEPLAGELQRAVWDMQAGQGFSEAMEKLRERAGGAEFSYLAVAMEVQHQTGSSLSDVLASVSQSLAGVAELEESLETQTTQGRLSARVVAIMPVAILALLSVLSPGYVTVFFESALGVCVFALAVLLELAGCVLVRKATSVDMGAGTLGGA